MVHPVYPFPWPVVLGPILVALWTLYGCWALSRVNPAQLQHAGSFNVTE